MSCSASKAAQELRPMINKRSFGSRLKSVYLYFYLFPASFVNTNMPMLNRKNFLRISGLSVLPAWLSATPFRAFAGAFETQPVKTKRVSFISDGPRYNPHDYIDKLRQINEEHEIEVDIYSAGGVVDELTAKFAAITGKEAATYMPTGTLANQLAMHVLSGDNSKVFVQETSHVYRDEADASQTVFNKRLVPLGAGAHYFTLDELRESIRYHNEEEAFKTGDATVSIEIPVRRCDNKAFPISEIKKISAFCRDNGHKLHLDGARIHIASAWTGVPVAEYASYFDTVYMCLYKYLGAAGGAVLCGDKAAIGKMEHLVRVHGGALFTSYLNAAMASYNLNGIDERLQRVKAKAEELTTIAKPASGNKNHRRERGYEFV